MGKKQYLQKALFQNWTATCKSVQLEQSLILYTKINLKQCKYLNVSPITIKLLEEEANKTLFGMTWSNNFLDLSPKANETKAKINGI